MPEVGGGGAEIPRYPIELELSVRIREGPVVHLRPIRPEDRDRLMTFHRHLSPRSVYRRFLGPHPELRPAEAERFTCVDYVDRLAFVVEDADELVAVGRYDRIPGTDVAEVAFVVADAYQHHGLGTVLLGQLAHAARSHGITTFVAETLAENHDMLDVFMHSGFAVATSTGNNVTEVRLAIDQAPPSGDRPVGEEIVDGRQGLRGRSKGFENPTL